MDYYVTWNQHYAHGVHPMSILLISYQFHAANFFEMITHRASQTKCSLCT
jgi:hypothetical protein